MSRFGVVASRSAIAAAVAAGVKHIRCDTPWGDLEQCEQMFTDSQGKWWPLLGYSSPRDSLAWNRAPNTQDMWAYAAWCSIFADHFKGRIEHIELRNEPNLAMFWDPQSIHTPILAAAMTNLAITAIRKVDKNVTIVACAISDGDATSKVSYPKFLKKYWDELIDKKNVIPCIHPYVFPTASYRIAHEITKTRVAVTEVGVSTNVKHGRNDMLKEKVDHLEAENAYAIFGYSFDDPGWALGTNVALFTK